MRDNEKLFGGAGSPIRPKAYVPEPNFCEEGESKLQMMQRERERHFRPARLPLLLSSSFRALRLRHDSEMIAGATDFWDTTPWRSGNVTTTRNRSARATSPRVCLHRTAKSPDHSACSPMIDSDTIATDARTIHEESVSKNSGRANQDSLTRARSAKIPSLRRRPEIFNTFSEQRQVSVRGAL
ncbi:hypothetical protein BST61_g1428 [Cercospora zeina]